MIGVVKSYDPRRGAGALMREDGGADVAVFVSEVERSGLGTLVVGQRLNFAIQPDRVAKRSFAVRLAPA